MKIGAGEYHSVVVDSEGGIWVAGENQRGELGLPGVTSTKGGQELRELAKFGNFNAVCCCASTSLLLDEDGNVWGAGNNTSGQLSGDNSYEAREIFTKMNAELPPIRFAALSRCYVLIDESGNAWNGGCNNYGQLGRGTASFFPAGNNSPLIIPDIPPVKLAACSILHSMLLTETGEVYGCGSNVSGQITGTNDEQKYLKFTHVPFEVPIENIAVGSHVSVFIDEEGGVWLHGVRKVIKLAGARKELNLPPMKDVAISDEAIFLIDFEGCVWAAGTNRYGQLGVEDKKMRQRFTKIPGLPCIIQVAAGKYHTLFLDIDGVLWGCGNNLKGELGMPTSSNQIRTPQQNTMAPVIATAARNRHKSAKSVL